MKFLAEVPESFWDEKLFSIKGWKIKKIKRRIAQGMRIAWCVCKKAAIVVMPLLAVIAAYQMFYGYKLTDAFVWGGAAILYFFVLKSNQPVLAKIFILVVGGLSYCWISLLIVGTLKAVFI